MNYKELTGKTIRESFEKFHRDNPKIYQLFEEQALGAIALGRKKISAKLIINWIRWNKFITTKQDDGFKINDAFHAHYARLFLKNHPEHEGVFELRRLRS